MCVQTVGTPSGRQWIWTVFWSCQVHTFRCKTGQLNPRGLQIWCVSWPNGWGPKKIGPRRVGGPNGGGLNFALFSVSHALFVSLSGGLLVVVWWCLEAPGPSCHVRAPAAPRTNFPAGEGNKKSEILGGPWGRVVLGKGRPGEGRSRGREAGCLLGGGVSGGSEPPPPLNPPPLLNPPP